MKLIFFTHPDFLGNKSMARFAKLLSEGMRKRGHDVEAWSAEPFLSNLSERPFIQKWLAYFDLFIIFPGKVRRRIKESDKSALFVFVDQTLGPWVPLVADRPNVIHCHDFLALLSAKGEIKENPTGWSGRIYQQMIRKGFSRGRNFISVSKKTKGDLHKLTLTTPSISEVVYNGLHQKFSRHEVPAARAAFSKVTGLSLDGGYLLHVGGNTWYKNRKGVVEIYESWRDFTETPLPLILVGVPLSTEMQSKVNASKYRADIHCLTEVNDDQLVYAYAGASLFLFPSLGEGFGWPIAEAMAAGALVVTTDEAPMSEVAGDAGYLVPKRPTNPTEVAKWAKGVANTVEKIVKLSHAEREEAVRKGIANALRFDTDKALDQIEAIYKKVLSASSNAAS